MSTKPDGGPAFPVPNSNNCGMSMRDWFAGQVLTTVAEGLSKANDNDLAPLVRRFKVTTREEIMAASCYELADAMIAERNKP